MCYFQNKVQVIDFVGGKLSMASIKTVYYTYTRRLFVADD